MNDNMKKWLIHGVKDRQSLKFDSVFIAFNFQATQNASILLWPLAAIWIARDWLIL
jgi:hypothetical protein